MQRALLQREPALSELWDLPAALERGRHKFRPLLRVLQGVCSVQIFKDTPKKTSPFQLRSASQPS